MKIYFTQSDDEYECQGMFSEEGECFGWWSCNDANWRQEYFRKFMDRIGIEVDTSNKFKAKLNAIAEEIW